MKTTYPHFCFKHKNSNSKLTVAYPGDCNISLRQQLPLTHCCHGNGCRRAVDCWLLTAGSWLRSLLVFCILVHFIDKLCAAHLWRGLDAQRRFRGYVSMAVLLHMQAVRIYASNFNAQEFFFKWSMHTDAGRLQLLSLYYCTTCM